MLFNTFTFVFFFLVVYTLYLHLSHRWQNILLLVASYVFYGWWDWRFIFLILFSTLIDYVCGLGIELAKRDLRKRIFLVISVVANLGILFVFKYFNFCVDSVIESARLLGLELHPRVLDVLLPVGISFYTFQSMSYTIDIFRGETRATRDPLDFAVYVAFFPQLVAGPIERSSRLLPQVQQERNVDYNRLREGVWLLLLGYFKKTVIADNMAHIAGAVFSNPSEYQGFACLLGVYAFAWQIYGDFSGYSDIARGLAKLMGFDLMVNFRLPYFARNPREFWQRWHISLSTWLRDYLYIPLGGNRGSRLLTYRNLFLTMLLGGLWHGAAWHFVIWGAYQGGLLAIHRLLSSKRKSPEPDNWLVWTGKVFIMFHLACLGWVFFRAEGMADVWTLLTQLFQWSWAEWEWAVLMLIYLFPLLILHVFQERTGDLMVVKRWPWWIRGATYALLWGYILLAGRSDGIKFIYFQF